MSEEPLIISPDLPPARPRFQFSLLHLLLFSVCIGACVVAAPLATLVILILVTICFGAARLFGAFAVIIMVVMLIAIGVLIPKITPRKLRFPALKQVKALRAAVENYAEIFESYPPENSSGNGSEVSFRMLCVPVRDSHGKFYGPFLTTPWQYVKDTDGNGKLEVLTPKGHSYKYRILSDSRILVIDPGLDGRLGGTIDVDRGFVPDNSDANGDGVPDHQDNINSLTD